MLGDEWCNLIQRYRSSVWAFNQAVDRLDSIPGLSFQRSWESAEDARKEVESARDAILQYDLRGSSTEAIRAKRAAADSYTSEELVLGDQGQSGG